MCARNHAQWPYSAKEVRVQVVAATHRSSSKPCLFRVRILDYLGNNNAKKRHTNHDVSAYTILSRALKIATYWLRGVVPYTPVSLPHTSFPFVAHTYPPCTSQVSRRPCLPDLRLSSPSHHELARVQTPACPAIPHMCAKPTGP